MSTSEIVSLIDLLNEKDSAQHSIEEVITTSPVTYVFRQEQKDEVEAITHNQNDPHNVAWTKKEALDLFDMTTEDDMVVIRETKKFSGTLNPRLLIEKLHLAINLLGGKVRYGTTVDSIKKGASGYELTGTESFFVKKVIIACGPYTKQLLQGFFPAMNNLALVRSDLSFFKLKDDVFNGLTDTQKDKFHSHFPVAEFDEEIYYSMVEYFEHDGSPVIKVGGHFKREDVTCPDVVWGRGVSQKQHSWALERTLNYLNLLQISVHPDDLVLVNEYACIYTLTENEVPLVVNRIDPEGNIDKNCVVIAGLSGVGAKGSLAYGRLASDLLLNLKSNEEMYLKTKREIGNDRLFPDTEL